MTEATNMGSPESDVHRSRIEDGSVGIFMGVSLMWIGVAWAFLPSVAGLAVVLPAIFVAPFVVWRTRFLGRSLNPARLGAKRRRSDGRSHFIALTAAVIIFSLAVVVHVLVHRDVADVLAILAPSLIAFLLAAAVFRVAVVTGLWRMFVAGVVLADGVLVLSAHTNPGLMLTLAGAVGAVWGMTRFITTRTSTEPL